MRLKLKIPAPLSLYICSTEQFLMQEEKPAPLSFDNYIVTYIPGTGTLQI